MQKTGYVEAYEEFSKGRRKLFGMGKGTLDEAVQHFRRALALDPQYAMAHSGLGATHAMRFIHRSEPDDLLQAREHLERALELDAELAEPYPWLCYIYMREGRLQEALDAGHRAIQLLPDFVQAHYFLALVYFVSCESNPGNYQSAANHLLRAGRVHPRFFSPSPAAALRWRSGFAGSRAQIGSPHARSEMQSSRTPPLSPGPSGLEFVAATNAARRRPA